jgi:hypothetical protein
MTRRRRAAVVACARRAGACLSVVVLCCSPGARAGAHHSAAAEYLLAQTVEIDGIITAFALRNPHSLIEIDVRDDSGAIHGWTVEWAPRVLLINDGITDATLRIGDRVRITGNPGRLATAYRLHMTTITRSGDHWSWKGG